MRFLYFAFFGLGMCATPPQRLRELFDSIKEFAKETGTTASSETSERIIEAAVCFANADGQKLDHYVDILHTVHGNEISKSELDRLAWEAFGRLFEMKCESSKTQTAEVKNDEQRANPVITGIPSTKSTGQQQSANPLASAVTGENSQIEKRSVKRSMEEDPDTARSIRSRSQDKERVLSILKFQRDLRNDSFKVTPGEGIDLLNYMHYRMVVTGDYDKLLYQLELFGALHEKFPQRVLHMFQDAYRKLEDPSFSIPKEQEERMEQEYQKQVEYFERYFDLYKFTNKLWNTCINRGAEYKEPRGAALEMSDRLVKMAKEGDFKALRYAIYMYEYAGYTGVRRRTVFQAVFDYLESLDKRSS